VGLRAAPGGAPVSTWQEGYQQGPSTAKAKRRAACRKAARASAIKRKQLARGGPRRPLRGEALALAYPVQQIGRAKFAALYMATCARLDWPFDRRGLNTAWKLYEVIWRAERVLGHHYETTTGRQRRALEKRGRRRCRRSVQYTARRLEAMGLVNTRPVRRRQNTPGHRDTIRIEILGLPRGGVEELGGGVELIAHAYGARTEGHSPSSSVRAFKGFPPPAAAVENLPAAGNVNTNGATNRRALASEQRQPIYEPPALPVPGRADRTAVPGSVRTGGLRARGGPGASRLPGSEADFLRGDPQLRPGGGAPVAGPGQAGFWEAMLWAAQVRTAVSLIRGGSWTPP